MVNALSEYMDVKISRGGLVYHDAYEKGRPVVELEQGLLPVVGRAGKAAPRSIFFRMENL